MASTQRVHVTYIIGVLISIIILLLTVQWGAIPELVAYITFALTLTSLVLALLAIIYAFFSSASATQQVATLRLASDDLSRTAAAIGLSAAELQNRIALIPPLFEDVGNKVSRTSELVEQLAKQSAVTEPAASKLSSSPMLSPEISTRVVSRGSIAGVLTLYAASIAFKQRVPLNLKDLIDKVPFTDYDYAWGYLVASNACGALSATGTSGVWNISEFSDDLAAKLKDRLRRSVSDGKTKPAIAKIAGYGPEVEAYLGVTPIVPPPD